jgi:hypothetical protein
MTGQSADQTYFPGTQQSQLRSIVTSQPRGEATSLAVKTSRCNHSFFRMSTLVRIKFSFPDGLLRYSRSRLI